MIGDSSYSDIQSNLETDCLRLDGVEDEEVVDGHVLLRQQLDRLLRSAAAHDARHGVQLAPAVPASNQGASRVASTAVFIHTFARL